MLADNKDYPQVLIESFDPELRRLKTETLITDGIDALLINSDGSVMSRIYDSNGLIISLGQKPMNQSIPVVLPSDQSISASLDESSTLGTVESGTVDTTYNEVVDVDANEVTTIVEYTATIATRLKIIEVSGTNAGEYTILVNSVPIHKKRTYYGNFDTAFNFSKGYHLDDTDVVTVTVKHTKEESGTFNAFILVLKED